jgi:hypothetical protein
MLKEVGIPLLFNRNSQQIEQKQKKRSISPKKFTFEA